VSIDDVGSDHSRVTPPGADGTAESRLEFHRHLFAYEEAGRRLVPESRVLEVGSGGGYGAQLLAGRGFRMTAVDPSMQAVRYSAQRYPEVRFGAASGTLLPFADASFDAVLSMQVIEHIDETRRYLLELRRVVRPGGRIILTTPNRLLRLFPLQRPWNPYHVREYSRRSLSSELSGLFADAQIEGVFAAPDLMRIERARVHQLRVGGVLATLRSFAGVRAISRFVQPRPPAIEASSPASSPASPGPAVRPIDQRDFHLAADTSQCLDLFVVATKRR
jgi:SAM-dependent methyltransferase